MKVGNEKYMKTKKGSKQEWWRNGEEVQRKYQDQREDQGLGNALENKWKYQYYRNKIEYVIGKVMKQEGGKEGKRKATEKRK
jgi:hypothetical protein